MQVNCSLCGGENEIQPGQKMLFCSYCGSSLAIDGRSGPEHLILPHERNDRNAREALTSFLLTRRMPRPKDIKTDFSYVPFLLVDDGKGGMKTVSGAAKAPAGMGVLGYAPAGCYRFFDEKLAGKERIVPAAKNKTAAARILHLPVYRMRYTAGGASWKASAVGESWQVYAENVPPEQPSTLSLQSLLIPAALFVAFLLLGALGNGWLSRFFITCCAALAGYALLFFRKKVMAKQ
jgi:hypothetical protein